MAGFDFQNDDKFCIFALYGTYTDAEELPAIVLSDGTIVLSLFPFALNDPWPEWLGSAAYEYVRKSNLVLISKIVSSTPAILDGESKTLFNDLHWVLQLLQLPGVLDYGRGYYVNGGFISGAPSVRQVGELETFYRDTEFDRNPLTVDRLEQAARVKTVWDGIEAGKNTLDSREVFMS